MPTLDIATAARAAEHYATSTGISCVVIDYEGRLVQPRSAENYPCRLCRLVQGREISVDTVAYPHAEQLRNADRFGGYYIFMCESSFTHWVSPIKEEGHILGGFVAGPVLTIDDAEFFEEEIRAAVDPDGANPDHDHLKTLFDAVPRIAPDRVTSLAELLAIIAAHVSRPESNPFAESAARLARESRLNEYIQELKQRRITTGDDPNTPSYPIEKETELLRAIDAGKVDTAQKVLNELLGHVFFTSGADLEVLKHRCRELVVLLSRTSIARGAETDQVFGLNYQFLDELQTKNDVNEIAHWMSRILRRFSASAFSVPRSAAHFRALRKVVDYIRRNYHRQLALEELAEIADLSPSYLSRRFHREMGERLSTYITRTRVEKAQELLTGTRIPVADIAGHVGFGDQSHLTTAFKKVTATTPAHYRNATRPGDAPRTPSAVKENG